MRSPPQKTPSSTSRVFSEEDEIDLLKAFNQSLTENPDLRFSSFHFRQFTQTQISSKLNRLKTKYHSMAKSKSKIQTPQHRQIYAISRKIWGRQNGNIEDISGGKEEVDLEKYPFLVESVPEELRRIGGLFFEGVRSLGEEKCKKLNDKWMVLSIQNTEIQTEKSLFLQKQFVLAAEAIRNAKM